MKALVVYYSRTGNTKLVGEAIAKALGADKEELVDTKRRGGPIGWIMAGRAGSAGMTTEIERPKMDPAEYDLVVIGSPTWAGGMAAATRAYIEEFRESLPNVAFFATAGGNADKTLAQMVELTGKEPAGTLAVLGETVKKDEYTSRAKQFAHQLQD